MDRLSQDTLTQRVVTINGRLVLNGVDVVPGGGGNASFSFDNYEPLLKTTNTIGQIAAGTTVAQLAESYDTVDKMFAALLDIRDVILSPINYSVTLVVNTTECELGVTTTLALQMRVDRGQWNNTPASGSTIPYGPVISGSFYDPFTSSTITTLWPSAASQGRIVLAEFAIFVEYTAPTTHTSITINQMSAQTDAGSPATSSTGSVTQMAPTLLNTQSSLTIRTFAFVYKKLSGVFYSNTSTGSTERSYSNTSEVYCYNFDAQLAAELHIPIRQPTKMRLREALLGGFSAQTEQAKGVVWDTDSYINSNGVLYWRVYMLNTAAYSTTIDMQILFS